MSNRRDFLKTLGAASMVGALPTIGLKEASAAGAYKIAVVGGGFAGASVARYLKLWGGAAVAVTLFDSVASYKTPILSNLVLNGQKSMSALTFSLSSAATRGGFEFVQGQVEGFDAAVTGYRGRLRVKKLNGSGYFSDTDLAAPASLYFHKMIVAPGIDFDYTGLESLLLANGTAPDLSLPIPHAWKSGDQVLNLKKQIDAMPNGGGVFVLSIPKSPYRCPPGPYERACVVADYLQRKRGGGKVIVLDANLPASSAPNDKYSAIQSEPHTFKEAFTNRFAGIVDYYSAAKLASAAAPTGQLGKKSVEVDLNDGFGPRMVLECNVLNVIPPVKAGAIAFAMGLVPSTGRFVDVDLLSYSTVADPSIYVIGDAHNSTQPKAGHIANSEAKVCADAILRSLQIITTPAQLPVTNSACYSPITSAEASWLTAGYRYNPDPALARNQRMQRIADSFGEASTVSSDNYKMMLAWANNLFADVGYTA